VAVIARALVPGGPGSRGAASLFTPTLNPLSFHEAQILGLLTQGLTHRVIAATLYISRKAASNHVANILARLEVKTRTAVVAIAVAELRRPLPTGARDLRGNAPCPRSNGSVSVLSAYDFWPRLVVASAAATPAERPGH
jgi:DNA-binding CsgD family transcriptional regulator